MISKLIAFSTLAMELRFLISTFVPNFSEPFSLKDILTSQQVLFFGNGASKCKDVIHSDNAIFIDDIVPLAENMGGIAEQKLAANDLADLAYFAPFYLKEFQATVSHKTEQVLGRCWT